MKKILIVVPSFNSGGTITSLLNVASSIDKNLYEVYVYAITNAGSNKAAIARVCKIVGEEDGTKRLTSSGGLKTKMMRFLKGSYKKLQGCGIDLSDMYFRHEIKKLEPYHFDYIIAFQEGTATRFVSMIPFSKRIAWVRSEYSRYLKINKNPDETPIYDKIDKIVSVSKASTNNFLNHFPHYQHKTFHVYNLINAERILKLSEEETHFQPDKDSFSIISIGRIDPVKRFDYIPSIAKGLLERGLEVNWIIVGGYSPMNEGTYLELKRKIEQEGMQEHVILFGQKNNPYPYLKACDLLVSLSSSETFNNTLTEAKILGVPVVTTDYECAFESVTQNVEGLIAPIEKIEETIAGILENRTLYETLRNHLQDYSYNGKQILNDLYTKILN